MKIILSKRMRLEAIGVFLVELGIMLLPFWWIFEDFELWVISELFIFIFLTSIFGTLMCCQFRLFTHVIAEKDCFKSFIFRKELCRVDKDRAIYYVRFVGVLTRGVRGEFVIISNQPFKYESPPLFRIFPREPKALIHSYNVKTQIAMPYNDETREILEMEKWIGVNIAQEDKRNK